MTKQYVLIIGVSHAHGGNDFNLLEKSQVDSFQASEGASGQDRESYSDDQDRDSYSVCEDHGDGNSYDDVLQYARAEGTRVADYVDALAEAARSGGTIIDVVALDD